MHMCEWAGLLLPQEIACYRCHIPTKLLPEPMLATTDWDSIAIAMRYCGFSSTIWIIISGSGNNLLPARHRAIIWTNVMASVSDFHKGDMESVTVAYLHDDALKWKHFPCYWPFVQGINWSAVSSDISYHCYGCPVVLTKMSTSVRCNKTAR